MGWQKIRSYFSHEITKASRTTKESQVCRNTVGILRINKGNRFKIYFWKLNIPYQFESGTIMATGKFIH
jgi:hypothetical protein